MTSSLEVGNSQQKDLPQKDGSGKVTEISAIDNEVTYFENVKQGSSNSTYSLESDHHAASNTRFRRFIDSFKKAEGPQPGSLDHDVLAGDSDIEGKPRTEPEKDDDARELKKTIKPRHVVMISLGTGIGTGMLVGNGTSLANSGPAGLVIGYAIMGSCIYCIIQATGELAVLYTKLTGGFNAYPSMLIDPAFGFAVAWVYCIQWLCVCPLELVTASMTIKYWTCLLYTSLPLPRNVSLFLLEK